LKNIENHITVTNHERRKLNDSLKRVTEELNKQKETRLGNQPGQSGKRKTKEMKNSKSYSQSVM
tara:strand:- start:587 stop:778 length:192 start_codon:yes stop_codon:yes gene_type:complete